jgi:ABC-type branched-subunit amino acid transport system substrate-binding protein
MAAADLARSRVPDVSLVVRDSSYDPEIAAREAAGLIEHRKVDAIFSSFSYVTAAVSPVSLRSETPLFYDSCNCSFAEENPHAFQIYFDPRKECKDAAKRFKDAGALKGAYLGLDVPYGKYCYESMQEVLGAGNVIIERESEGVMRNYSLLLASLRSQGAEFIVSVPAVADFPALFTANEASEKPLPIVCYAGACLSAKEAASAEHVETFSFRLRHDFRRRIEAMDPKLGASEVSQAAVAYDAVMHAVLSARQCPPGAGNCLVEAAAKPRAGRAIVSGGFGQDHILDYESEIVK